VRSSVIRALRPRVKRWRPSAQHAPGQVRRRRGWTGATWLSATRSMSSAGGAGSGRRDEPRRGSRSARVARSVARGGSVAGVHIDRPSRAILDDLGLDALAVSVGRLKRGDDHGCGRIIPAPACAPPSHVPRGVTRIEAEVADGMKGEITKASKGDAIEQPSGTHRPPRLSETATTSFERRAGARRRIRRREAKRCVPPPRCASPVSVQWNLRQAGWRWLWLLRLGRGCAFDGMGAVRAGAQPYLGPRPSGVAGRRRNG